METELDEVKLRSPFLPIAWIIFFVLCFVGLLAGGLLSGIPPMSGRGSMRTVGTILAQLMPFVAAYGVIAFIASRPFRANWARWIAGAVAVALVGLGYPFATYSLAERRASALRASDTPLRQPLPAFGSILLQSEIGFSPDPATASSWERHALDCKSLCQRLLYNGAAQRVVVEAHLEQPGSSPSVRQKTYRVERRSQCPIIDIFGDNSTDWETYESGNTTPDRLLRRIVLGECLVSDYPDGDMTDLVLDRRSPTGVRGFAFGYDQNSVFRVPAVGSVRIELRDRRGGRETVLFRRTKTHVVTLVPFLLMQIPDLGGISSDDWREEAVLREIFGEAVRKPKDIADHFVLRDRVEQLLDDQASDHPTLDRMAGAYMRSVGAASAVEARDLTIIRKIIESPAVKFGTISSTLPHLQIAQLDVIAGELVARFRQHLEAYPASAWLGSVGRQIGRLSDARFAEFAPLLLQIMTTPQKALAAPRAFKRLAGQGARGAAHYEAVIGQMTPSQLQNFDNLTR
jgi:hypothetical protein